MKQLCTVPKQNFPLGTKVNLPTNQPKVTWWP